MKERGDFTTCRHLDAKFLLLKRLEPAVRPAPEAQVASHKGVGLFQYQLAFQEDFRLIVVSKHRGMPVARGRESLRAQKCFGERQRGITGHPEVDRSFRKR